MQSLKFNDGLVRLAINGNESRVITINPTDFGILTRFEEAEPKIEKIIEDAQNKETGDKKDGVKLLAELDKKLKEMVDFIVGSPVSDIVFGNTNCISLAGGSYIFMNFLEAYISYLEPKIKGEFEKSKAKIEKYTRQVK